MDNNARLMARVEMRCTFVETCLQGERSIGNKDKIELSKNSNCCSVILLIKYKIHRIFDKRLLSNNFKLDH